MVHLYLYFFPPWNVPSWISHILLCSALQDNAVCPHCTCWVLHSVLVLVPYLCGSFHSFDIYRRIFTISCQWYYVMYLLEPTQLASLTLKLYPIMKEYCLDKHGKAIQTSGCLSLNLPLSSFCCNFFRLQFNHILIL